MGTVPAVKTTMLLNCGHTITYNGTPKNAEHEIFRQRGVINRHGESKCRECIRDFAAALYEGLRYYRKGDD